MGREDEVIELKKQLHLIEDSRRRHVLCEERKQQLEQELTHMTNLHGAQ